MKKDKKSLIAYASGYFDGEGCISTKSGKNRPLWSCQPGIYFVCRNSQEPIKLFKGLFGGYSSIWYTKRDQKCFYQWKIENAEGVRKVLKLMLPFLKIKKAQAELAIRYTERMIVGKRKGRYKLTEREKEVRMDLAKRIRAFNHKVPEELVRAETKRRDADLSANR